MLKRNNVWKYSEGLLQACISSNLVNSGVASSISWGWGGGGGGYSYILSFEIDCFYRL